jgi:DNA adenine methylase
VNLCRRSPLRYPGGKARLTKYFSKLLEANDLSGTTYIEPYAGGAGVALGLLMNNFVSNIIINDIDKSIYAFWYSIVNEPDRFCDAILSTPVSVEEWRKQKSIQNNNDSSLFELGFSTFFLNRTNRSGILKAGIIGGWKQLGDYKINCRFNKDNLIKLIKDIAQFSKRIKVFNYSAEELIKRSISKYKNNNAFVFFDPPYFENGCKLYTNYYSSDDHRNLKDLIEKHVKVPWVITYDNVEQVKQLYQGYRYEEYNLSYSAASKRVASEIMIFSRSLTNPIKPFL